MTLWKIKLSIQNLLSTMLCASIGIVVLLPSVVSSEEHAQRNHIHASSKHHNQQVSPRLSFEIALHGFLLWASMGFLMPLGIVIIRMTNGLKSERKLKILLYFHVTLQILALVLATTAAVMSFKNFENSFNNDHQRIGLALYIMIWLQVLSGVLRARRGSKARSIWFFLHWIMGTTVSLLGVANIYMGLQAYNKKASKSVRGWTMGFTFQMSIIVFIYLFQDKWDYIKKQGVILGNEPVQPTDQEAASPNDKRKETTSESC